MGGAGRVARDSRDSAARVKRWRGEDQVGPGRYRHAGGGGSAVAAPDEFVVEIVGEDEVVVETQLVPQEPPDDVVGVENGPVRRQFRPRHPEDQQLVGSHVADPTGSFPQSEAENLAGFPSGREAYNHRHRSGAASSSRSGAAIPFNAPAARAP